MGDTWGLPCRLNSSSLFLSPYQLHTILRLQPHQKCLPQSTSRASLTRRPRRRSRIFSASAARSIPSQSPPNPMHLMRKSRPLWLSRKKPRPKLLCFWITPSWANLKSTFPLQAPSKMSLPRPVLPSPPRSQMTTLPKKTSLSDNVINRAITVDKEHGFSSRFTTALSSFDQKYKASDKAKSVDTKYGVTDKAMSAWGGLNSYFEKAMNTPTGQRVRQYYVQGDKQVRDVHNEARRLADL